MTALAAAKGIRCFGYYDHRQLCPLHPRGEAGEPAAESRRHLQPPAARPLPVRPRPRRWPAADKPAPPASREFAREGGRAAVPFVFHARGLPETSDTARGRPSRPGSTMTPAGMRRSASCASTTERPTEPKPRATGHATRATTAAGACHAARTPAADLQPPCHPRRARRRRSSPSLKARNALTSPRVSACRAPRPAPTAHRRLQLTDWSPLAGRSVAILRDEGENGARYAAKVAAILAALDPPADVRIVRLPGLSDGEDIEQWLAARRSSGSPTPKFSPSCLP